MSEEIESTITVNYTVKELLHSMQESLVRIETRLDSKASLAAHEALAERVSVLELAKARLYGAMAVIGFLAGGGGYVLAQLMNTPVGQ